MLLQPGIAFIERAKYLFAEILSGIFMVCGDFPVEESLNRNVCLGIIENPFKEFHNFLLGTKTVLRDTEYALQDTNKHSLLGTYNQPAKQTSLVRCVKSSLQRFVKAMPSSEYSNIIADCDVVNNNVCINQVHIVNQHMIP